ncbi:MAG: hypothetical protein A3B38_00730 [Candidatus Levybacteria bacterium RIFCSPLOWO2_01_FULL_36_13]|nr:MAG: hypothetical protein A2684_01970 [Candidatus Levybacteria bacterium RIFCSPHIGHO2_01_FULL_36_15b]OGH35413.1 MAG: hypothetical protein A3B38_00730 [Candidatus Levybacteria bacterium RIFCSPLOWO2_01_FULL_36_13]
MQPKDFEEIIIFEDTASGVKSPLPSIEDSKQELKESIKEEIEDEAAKREEKSKQKMDELIKSSQKPLYKLSTIFPLDLFPDKLIIEFDHVNIYFHEFFSTGQVRSVPIQNIGEVIIETSPLFTTLKIIEGMIGAGVELDLKPVRRSEAIKAKRIIMGLMIADKEKVDLSDLDSADVARKVEELGKAQEPEFMSN